MAILKNTTIDDTNALVLPVGTTVQRPVSPQGGMVRFNTTTLRVEFYDAISNTWRNIQVK